MSSHSLDDSYNSKQSSLGISDAAPGSATTQFSTIVNTYKHGRAYSYADVKDDYGWTPLHLAALLNRVEIARILMTYFKPSILVYSKKKKFTSLHIAASKGHIEIISLIVTDGVSSTCFHPAHVVL